jgi:uroporphyrinogen decarboxylase
MSSTIEAFAYNRLKQHMGITSPTTTFCRNHSIIEERILEFLKVDTRYLYLDILEEGRPIQGKTIVDDSYIDEWGVKWKKIRGGYYWEMIEHPIERAEVHDLEEYHWPEPSQLGSLKGIEDRAKFLYEETDYAVVVEPFGSVFEQSWYLRGFVRFLTDLLANPDFAVTLMEKVTEIALMHIDRLISRVGSYVQIVNIGDDLGMQDGLIISPEIYRRLVKPFHRRIIECIKKRTNAYVFFHTDGSVFELIPDLIDVGVDILSPVQPLAKGMESERLKSDFGTVLTFHGGVDVQKVLPRGTPVEVEKEVERRIKAFGIGGGYIVAPAHNIQPDVPPENIIALSNAVAKYGRYPI